MTMRLKISYFHWLNLDLAGGIIAVYAAWSGIPGSHPERPAALPLVILCTVFGFSLLYYLRASVQKGAASKQDLFYRTHRLPLQITAGISLLAALAAGWSLPDTLRMPAGAFATAGGLFLLALAWLPAGSQARLWRDPLAAALLTGAVWTACRLQQEDKNWLLPAIGITFGFVSAQNVLLSSHFETLHNRKKNTLAKKIGKKATHRLVLLLMLCALVATALICWYTAHRYVQRLAILTALMGVLQYWMFGNFKGYSRTEDFRLVNNLVFLMPALVL